MLLLTVQLILATPDQDVMMLHHFVLARLKIVDLCCIAGNRTSIKFGEIAENGYCENFIFTDLVNWHMT